MAGRAAWQVLAGAVGGQPVHTRLHYSGDPFGVWYPVFGWRRWADLSPGAVD